MVFKTLMTQFQKLHYDLWKVLRFLRIWEKLRKHFFFTTKLKFEIFLYFWNAEKNTFKKIFIPLHRFCCCYFFQKFWGFFESFRPKIIETQDMLYIVEKVILIRFKWRIKVCGTLVETLLWPLKEHQMPLKIWKK